VPEDHRPAAERARQLAGTAPEQARVFATLELADALRQAGMSLAGALVEAARIRAGHRR
jgi:hypothetical protein